MFFVITLVFFNCVIKLYNFRLIRLHINDYDQKVYNSNNYYIIYKSITYYNMYWDKI